MFVILQVELIPFLLGLLTSHTWALNRFLSKAFGAFPFVRLSPFVSSVGGGWRSRARARTDTFARTHARTHVVHRCQPNYIIIIWHRTFCVSGT